MTLPDGPTTLPIVQMMQAILQPVQTLENNFQKYGDCYTARVNGFGPLVVLTHPKAVEALMTAPPELFDSGVTNRAFQPFFGPTSVVLLDGKPHQRQRKLLTPPFHGERLKAYGQAICNITRQVTEQWQPGKTLSIRSATQAISLKVIMRTVFGVYKGERAERLEHHLHKFLGFFDLPLNAAFAFIPALQQDWGPWSPWGAMVRQSKAIDNLLYAEIQERRANPDLLGDDILSLMLVAKDEEGQSMTDGELRDELMTLLFAGHETTATAIAWAMYWIHRQPEVGQKLRKELDELDENTDPVTLARLPYLSALCDETLRIYPVGLFTFFRVLKAPWTLMGQDFEAGTQFSPCIYLLHHRPELYPDPDQFRPERFLERQFSLYEYIPFGGGNRRCLGMAFALFEMKLVLATILSQWQLQLTSDRPIHPIRRGFTIAPEKGVPMRVLERRRA
jgi:cytochrome P450 family 110